MRQDIKNFIISIEKILYHKIPYINPWYFLYIIFQLITFFIFSRLSIRFNLELWTPQLDMDMHVPLFMPMVIPYVLYAPFILLPMFLPMKRMQERLLVLNLVLVSVITYISSFTTTTTVSARVPLFDQPEGYLIHILNWIYRADPNSLYFPSLHVAHSLLIGFALWEPRSYRQIFVFIALLISTSTVFVKQHFLLDALFGGLVAIAVFYLTPYLIKFVFRIKRM